MDRSRLASVVAAFVAAFVTTVFLDRKHRKDSGR